MLTHSQRCDLERYANEHGGEKAWDEAYRLGVEQERKLTKISQVGNTIFHPGVSVQMLVERAEREYEYEQTPERKALRKERLEHFRAAIERGE